jgi:hypothetical protein
MTDQWELTIVDINDQPLACYQAEFLGDTDEGLKFYVHSTRSLNAGTAHEYILTNNRRIVARNDEHYKHFSITYNTANLSLMGVSEFYVPHRFCVKIAVDKPKVCTCGGWAVYGRDADIHADDFSNTCELRMT